MSNGNDAPADALRLGLIGDNIAASEAPRLHRLAGRMSGVPVRYDLLVPREIGRPFDAIFDACAEGGYRGINVTYPYKERAARRVRPAEPLVRAMGAVNTVIFGAEGPVGYNTDHSGFLDAYRAARDDLPPGPTLVIGAGGAGRAVAFGLAALGARDLRLVDRDPDRAATLAADLRRWLPELTVETGTEAGPAARGMAGLANCTPVGMVGHEGSPLASGAVAGAAWAFDAVYTPRDTPFLTAAAAAGLTLVPGWELFFHQGVRAWALFSGRPVALDPFRARLLSGED